MYVGVRSRHLFLSDLVVSLLVSHYTPMCPKSTAITQLLEGLQCNLMGVISIMY